MRVLEETGPITSLAWSSDGRWLASASDVSGEVKLWPRGETPDDEVGELEIHTGSLAFSRDGKQLAWGTVSGVEILDVSSQTRLKKALPEAVRFTSLTFDLAGKNLLATFERQAGDSGTRTGVRCWNVKSNKERKHPLWPEWHWHDSAGQIEGVSCLAFSPAGKCVAVGSLYSWLFVYEWPSGEERHALVAGTVRALAFSPDSRRLATLIRSNRVTVWDLDAGEREREYKAHRSQALSVAFSPDGQTLATGSKDETVILWDVTNWREKARHDWSVGPVRCLAFAPDGATLAVGGDSGLIVCDVEGD